MKTEYNKSYSVSYSNVAKNAQLSLVSAITLVQDMMTEYFESFGSDNIVLKKENKAIWVLARTKIHFIKKPKWKEIIKGNAYTTKITPIRVETETKFTNIDNEPLFYANQQSCVIDLESRKIRKVDSVNYPLDMEVRPTYTKINYLKLNEHFKEKDKIYEKKVFSTDIDYSGHTNNAIYVRCVVDTLSCEFIDNHIITDFEIQYISESKEGQTLEIYRKIKENEIDFLIKEGEREIIRANLKYKAI